MKKVWGRDICVQQPISSSERVEQGAGLPLDVPAYHRYPEHNWPTVEQFFRFAASDFDEVKMESVNSKTTKYHLQRGAYHWWPISRQCYPCDIKYDYIVHTETLNEDLHYILVKANPHLPADYLDPASVSDSKQNKGGSVSDELKKILLKRLPKDLLHDLLEDYMDDYHMFGYDYQESLKDNLN